MKRCGQRELFFQRLFAQLLLLSSIIMGYVKPGSETQGTRGIMFNIKRLRIIRNSKLVQAQKVYVSSYIVNAPNSCTSMTAGRGYVIAA
jgi:spore coat polysaccharide biosynthesis protein SpsF (cytidylyltransferase family)